jgi:hypothetical protein
MNTAARMKRIWSVVVAVAIAIAVAPAVGNASAPPTKTQVRANLLTFTNLRALPHKANFTVPHLVALCGVQQSLPIPSFHVWKGWSSKDNSETKCSSYTAEGLYSIPFSRFTLSLKGTKAFCTTQHDGNKEVLMYEDECQFVDGAVRYVLDILEGAYANAPPNNVAPLKRLTARAVKKASQ